VDGTKYFKNGTHEYAFSLGRLVWNGEIEKYVGEYSLVQAPVFESEYKGKKLSGVLVEFNYNQQRADVYSVNEKGDVVFEKNITPFTDEIQKSGNMDLFIRSSTTVSEDPFRKRLESIYGNRQVNKNAKWGPSVTGILELIFGRFAMFSNPPMSLWDHASLLPVVLFLGGAAFRADTGERCIGYGKEDIFNASDEEGKGETKKDKFNLLITIGGMYSYNAANVAKADAVNKSSETTMASQDNSRLGGIDFNSESVVINEQGEGYNLSMTSGGLNYTELTNSITAIKPTIIDVSTITNFQSFVGVK